MSGYSGTLECSNRHTAHQTWLCESVGVLRARSLSLSLHLTLIRTRPPYGLLQLRAYFLPGPLLLKKKRKKESNINKTNKSQLTYTDAFIITSPSPPRVRGRREGWDFVGAQAVRSWCERCIKCPTVMLPYKTARYILAQRGTHQFNPRLCPPDSH